MNFQDILNWLTQIEGDLDSALSPSNDPTRWDVAIENPPGGPKTVLSATASSLSSTGMSIAFEYEGTTYTVVHGLYGDTTVNGVTDPGCAVVFRPAGSFGNPLRVHIDFRPLTLGGVAVRLDTAFPKG